MANPAPYRRKIRFSDTDAQGHAFNANYFVYFDDALTDFLDAVGLSYAELAEQGHDVVLARAECDFRSSAQLGETLEVSIAVERVGNTSIVFGLRAAEVGSGRTVAEGREVYVVIERATGTPVRVPDYARAALGVTA